MKSKKVLVIDDEIGVFMSIKMTLDGCRVIPAHCGMEGIELFKRERPDLIFLDLKMPDIDGIDVLRIIRKLDKTTPVIVLTAFPGDVVDLYMDELNITAYFVKPFDMKKLGKEVNKILGGQR